MTLADNQRDCADWLSIVELRHRYCHYADAHKYEAWADLFTKDAVIDAEGRDLREGRDDILVFGREVLDEEYDYSAHLVMNPLISIDEDEATGQWYVYLVYSLSDGRSGWKQGRYDEAYRRVDGTWKFAHVEAEFFATKTYEPLCRH